ncbi:hypothetical protein PGT21_008916 [Puccinia graminis f. sp. tritici]|nr:hypothetical protein PGTUg99_017512 [Puccinia graminis f. sp. tritici]KAA1112765.1 hypothetical protein PGT21_008916 [Puccinia graminis f. sp. tritici]
MVQLLPKSFPSEYPATALLWAVLLGVALIQLEAAGMQCPALPGSQCALEAPVLARMQECGQTFICNFGEPHGWPPCRKLVPVFSRKCMMCGNSYGFQGECIEWGPAHHQTPGCPAVKQGLAEGHGTYPNRYMEPGWTT